MTKSTSTYWNALDAESRERWTPEGMAEELTLSLDPVTGEYTRLTRFLPGADTALFGGRSHSYPEEVFIVSGRLFDEAFDMWLEEGVIRQPSARRAPRPVQDGCRLCGVGSVVSE